MSREDFWAVLWIGSMVFSLGELVDRQFFSKERMVNSLIKETKEKGKCVCCGRSVTFVSEGEA